MKVLGIDPDTKNTGLAVVEFDGGLPTVVWVSTASINARLPVAERIERMHMEISGQLLDLDMLDDCIVEGQEKYPRDNVRPNDLIHLAQVAGSAAQAVHMHSHILPTIVKPRDWKGQVPKPIHQKRILSKVSIDPDSGFDSLTKTQQGHVVDAIGLALWGYQQQKLHTLP